VQIVISVVAQENRKHQEANEAREDGHHDRQQ
jgi:hypothetical protein